MSKKVSLLILAILALINLVIGILFNAVFNYFACGFVVAMMVVILDK
jgi:hypothetical protein